MPTELLFPGATLEQFRSLFQSKKEYREAIRQMDLKERLLDWKPTTLLEAEMQRPRIVPPAFKIASLRRRGGSTVTTYRLNDAPDSSTAYMSYGGGVLLVAAEGRKNDDGYFLKASQTPDGLRVVVKTKREHERFRTLTTNAFYIVVGLFLAVLPGIAFAVFFYIVEPRINSKYIKEELAPRLAAVLEPTASTNRDGAVAHESNP